MATQFDIKLDNNILIIDIGNSRMKYIIDNLVSSLDYNLQDFPINFEKIIMDNRIIQIYYSSVNSEVEEIILTICKEFKIQVNNIEEFIDKQNTIDFTQVTNMGIDRKLGLFGAISITNSPLITIDCGTALTMNYLDKDNICRGGGIFAGLDTQFKALSNYTDKLKNYKYENPNNTFGTNTQEAISIGVLYSIIGGIKEFYYQNKPTNQNINVILTGGYSEIIFSALSKSEISVILKKNLVLDGIIYLINNNLKKN
ncbi:MAG: type III pantothenate kinase [Candidatus Kapabacteria bacterium]|nr:type III pantothenate kinase [Candidatus Kapabacteria bacterium]